MKILLGIKQVILDNPFILLFVNTSFRRTSGVMLFAGVIVVVGLVSFFTYFGVIRTSEDMGPYTLAEMGSRYFWIILGTIAVVTGIIAYLSGSTAINTERSSKTFDFLIIAGSRPEHIVLGKLARIVVQVFLVIFAALPMVFLSIYLGGIDLPTALIAFYYLFLSVSIIAGISLAFSSFIKHIAGSAALSVSIIGLIVYGSAIVIGNLIRVKQYPPITEIWLLAVVCPAIVWLLIMTGVFFIASAGLKGYFTNRTGAIKGWYIFAVLIIVLGIFWLGNPVWGADIPPDLAIYALLILSILFSFMCLEPSIIHPALEMKWKSLPYIFRPGGARNFIFLEVVHCIGILAGYLLYENIWKPPYLFQEYHQPEVLLLYLFVWTSFMNACSLLIGSMRTNFIYMNPYTIYGCFLGFILCIFPMIRGIVAGIVGENLSESFDIYLSPALALGFLLYIKPSSSFLIGVCLLIVISCICTAVAHFQIEKLKKIVSGS